MSNVKHSNQYNSWHTPSEVVEAARQVLGGIDFDPASDRIANLTVQAAAFYSEKSIETPWFGGSIFLNPPGGKVGNDSQTALFWEKLMGHRHFAAFTHAIFVGFSIEVLQVTQLLSCESVGEFPICLPRRRIKFVKDSGPDRPSHANVIAYIPGTIDKTQSFKTVFSDFGIILNA